MNDETNYTAKEIQVLAGLEGVRKRPGMYIGDTYKRGLHHLVFEIVDNSIDEALAGYCKNITVVLNKDGSTAIKDDGRGIPVDKHTSGKSALEVVSSSLHAGGKFEKKAYKVSGGLHGVGMSVVNALSESMRIDVHREGKIHSIGYSKGKVVSPVSIVGDTTHRGTVVTFKPDPTIFQSCEFDYEYLKERIMELAFLNKGLVMHLIDERNGKTEQFCYQGGIVEFVTYLNQARNRLHDPVYFTKKADHIEIEVALQYTDSYNEMIYSFVNDIKTIEGGTHLVGFRTAVTRAVNDFARSNKLIKEDHKLTGDDAIEGMTAILSLKIPEPQFEGQTKTKLGNSEVRGYVDSMLYDALKTYFEEHPQEAKQVMNKVVNAMEAREAAQKAKELIRRKNVFESSILPGKLADCSEEDPAKSEIYFVEGDSAGGSSKQARDRRTQAILPLRGKILNVEKAPMHKVLTSEEIKNIVVSIGAGFKDDFDVKKVRYHKIIIMTDADVDGSHIRTLILTLFYRYFRSVIEQGYLYIAQPPLYRIQKGKHIQYAYSDAQLAEILKQVGEGSGIQRYKGLGEMNPTQLWETTMNPETRTLKKVTIEDGIVADELFTILMGDQVEPRKKFIEEHAALVKNLDI
ncbi:DNA gyrase subunit B [Candidatus Bilamarchaeum dharawalense]|uniref:DNA gyrase subunit B n=1 Tax=Candidatus Bilamarchaeum dharawalense TaxID=2885759 RepID=A0A5E4LWQ2_9ARCH|nr:DNA gyrase subunit B [Candidatus Bilamarchaeum dharawalense]